MFLEPRAFDFVVNLETSYAAIRAELDALGDDDFQPSPDSLTTVADGYDETGWSYCELHGAPGAEAVRARCPVAARVAAAVPGMRNAGFSRLAPGTHLYPHRGELASVLRCHLPLVVPAGDLGLRIGSETRRWLVGRCLVFDDTFEHEAWNHGDGDRIVLLITFRS